MPARVGYGLWSFDFGTSEQPVVGDRRQALHRARAAALVASVHVRASRPSLDDRRHDDERCRCSRTRRRRRRPRSSPQLTCDELVDAPRPRRARRRTPIAAPVEGDVGDWRDDAGVRCVVPVCDLPSSVICSAGRALRAASVAASRGEPDQVPSSHEARYFACSSVSWSIVTPIVASLRRAISSSISRGTG